MSRAWREPTRELGGLRATGAALSVTLVFYRPGGGITPRGPIARTWERHCPTAGRRPTSAVCGDFRLGWSHAPVEPAEPQPCLYAWHRCLCVLCGDPVAFLPSRVRSCDGKPRVWHSVGKHFVPCRSHSQSNGFQAWLHPGVSWEVSESAPGPSSRLGVGAQPSNLCL